MAELGGKNLLLEISNGTTQAVTFTDSGDLVGLTAHGLTDGDVVSFTVINTTTGISIDTNYFVVNANTNDFQVAATAGGSPITLTTDGTGTLDEVFQTIGGLRSKSFSINAEAIDITNHDSSEWREILDSAGIRSVSLSGSGVFEDGTVINQLKTDMMANTLRKFRVYMTSDLDYFQGTFKITALEYSGDYNAEAAYSISMESSGTITYNAI